MNKTMLTAPILQKRSTRFLLIFAGWTTVGLFLSSRYVMISANMSSPIPWIQQFLPLIDAYVWAALTPFIIFFTRKYPLAAETRRRDIFAHLLFSVLFSSVQASLYVLISELLPIPAYADSTFARRLSDGVLFGLHSGVLTYAVIVFVVLGMNYYHRFKEGELRASRLQSQLSEAQLQALKMQLHPHFLFNTLHAISTLVHKDADAAEQMIARLSELLRMVLENPGQQKVKLRDELALLDKYLEIEQVRFPDRLHVERKIDEKTLDAYVPNLILQPLVENAIRHGISKKAQAGDIRLRAARDNGVLHLSIADDGPGLENHGTDHISEGVGLKNTRGRLAQLYGKNYTFALAEADGGGLEINITIPYENSNNHRR